MHDLAPLTIVPAGAPESEWLAGRAEHGVVTASEIPRIARGGRGTHRSILDDKLNGATFKGNAHTARGHEREPFLIHYLAENVASITPNTALLAHPERTLDRATPDGLGTDPARGFFAVQVKSHDHGWTLDRIPDEHLDQVIWEGHVVGGRWALYGWEVMGEDGAPTLDDPRFEWIDLLAPKNVARLKRLKREADAFRDWWAAGAPAADDIPDDLEEALATWADARARKSAAEAEEKAANAVIRAHIAKRPKEERDGLKLAGTRAFFTYAMTEEPQLDVKAWEAAEPNLYAAWLADSERVASVASDATDRFSIPTLKTRLNIYPTKEKA